MFSHKGDKKEVVELKDEFVKDIASLYLNEVKTYPKVLRLEDAVLQQEDLQGPKKEGVIRLRRIYNFL